MRSLALAAILSLLITPAALAGDGPYKLDAQGKCHDAKGHFAKADLCKGTAAAPKRCKDAKGKFAKCGTPGAKPA